MWNKASDVTHNKSIHSKKENNQDFTKLDPFDGKLEFLSFKNRFYFGLCERTCTGGGMKIAQGKFQAFLIEFFSF